MGAGGERTPRPQASMAEARRGSQRVREALETLPAGASPVLPGAQALTIPRRSRPLDLSSREREGTDRNREPSSSTARQSPTLSRGDRREQETACAGIGGAAVTLTVHTSELSTAPLEVLEEKRSGPQRSTPERVTPATTEAALGRRARGISLSWPLGACCRNLPPWQGASTGDRPQRREIGERLSPRAAGGAAGTGEARRSGQVRAELGRGRA